MLRRDFLAGAASLASTPPAGKTTSPSLVDALKMIQDTLGKDAAVGHFEVNYNPDSAAMLVIVAYRKVSASLAEQDADYF